MASFQAVLAALCFAAAHSESPDYVRSPDGMFTVSREKFYEDNFGYANPADAPNEVENYEASWLDFVKKVENGEVTVTKKKEQHPFWDLMDSIDDNWRYMFFPVAYCAVGYQLWKVTKTEKAKKKKKEEEEAKAKEEAKSKDQKKDGKDDKKEDKKDDKKEDKKEEKKDK